MPTSWKNVIFSLKLQNFHVGAQIGCKSRKTTSHIFWLFTPLYRRFRPSSALQTIDLEEIYRFLSKILDFMPCGSVFGQFCVLCTNLMALASKIYRKSIENLSKSIENLSKIYRKSIENLSKIYVSEVYLRCIWGVSAVYLGLL